MLILGIESSCDETAASVIQDDGTILSSVVYSQIKDHQKYGGVVPELAARKHLEVIPDVYQECINKANISHKDIDLIASTIGPGLLRGLIVGSVFAKSLALSLGKDFIGVNHLEGHVLTPRLTHQVKFPYLMLLVSGGHTSLVAVEGVGLYHVYGETIDDAVGEAFDKTAKLLGLTYPGGPSLEKIVQDTDLSSIEEPSWTLPCPMLHQNTLDFSFSGLKTAVRILIEREYKNTLSQTNKALISQKFQESVTTTLITKIAKACDRFINQFQTSPTIVIAGGVARNNMLREKLNIFCQQKNLQFFAPPHDLCSDNAVMIAWAGYERFRTFHKLSSFDIKPRPRWSLDTLTEETKGEIT